MSSSQEKQHIISSSEFLPRPLIVLFLELGAVLCCVVGWLLDHPQEDLWEGPESGTQSQKVVVFSKHVYGATSTVHSRQS